MKKAIFLDRDGVINYPIKRLNNSNQFNLIEGVAEAIKKINDNGYLVIVVTNQPDIAKGFCTFEDIDKINKKMKKLLYEKGAHIDDIYICPHHPEKGFEGEIKELKIDCECRKPKPGLFLKAIKEHDINPKESWIIGDSKTDVVAGHGASLKTIFLTSSRGSGSKQEEDYKDIKPNLIKKDLQDAINSIFK